MDSSIGTLLLIQVVLIALNAIFACAETAIISINDNKMAMLAAEGDKRAVRLMELTKEPAGFLSTNVVLRIMGIDPNEEEFIQNVFEFDDIPAREIVTHRTKLVLLWMEDSMEQWEETIHDTRHTLYPICEDTADQIIGILNAKDYFRLKDKSRENVMANAVRKPYFVPDGVKADVLFKNMKQSRNSMAIIVDENGGTQGVITINDLLEQLVGDLEVDKE